MPIVTLKPGREKSLKHRHPWIFSNALAKVDGSPEPGATVLVRTADGHQIGRGAYSPHSQIRVRMWTFDPQEEVAEAFFRARLERAIQSRQAVFAQAQTTAYRLVNAESDGLPGIIVDRYADFLVCQFLAAGAEYWKQTLVQLLHDTVPNTGIYERSDVDVREKEGLPLCQGVLVGQKPPESVEIQEDQYRFWVDIVNGQKTGFYLDQRDNRRLVTEYSKGADVLNAFAYTGGFAIRALRGGAKSVTNVDSSESALALGMENVTLNNVDPTTVENMQGDVFQVLRRYLDARRRFDLIILDPPKFVTSRSQLTRACRGYKDINLLAFKLLRTNGSLFTFSCSGLLPPELFQKIVADAALDAGRDAQILRRLSQAPDHPTALNFPEGSYLKGLVCKVLE